MPETTMFAAYESINKGAAEITAGFNSKKAQALTHTKIIDILKKVNRVK